MILYIVNGEGYAPDARLSPFFSETRREKLARLKTDEGRSQSACAEMAYMLACMEALGSIPPYEYGDNNKPKMVHPQDGFFSLSHAGPYGLCAWAEQPVGADIESEMRDLTRIARRVKAPAEQEEDLNRIWCMKESYVKLTGEGLSHPFPQMIATRNTITDTEGNELAACETALVSAYRWCVSTGEREEIRLRIVTAKEAEERILAYFENA